MQYDEINLPETIDGWRLEGPPRRIDKTNIFDYMDGAGELYLSHENILNLNHSTEAVIVTYEKEPSDREPPSARLLVIKYPDNEQAVTALEDFIKAYLPDQKREIKLDINQENKDFLQIEDGWMGYRLLNQYLALVFECADQRSTQGIMNQAVLNKH